MSGFGGNGGRGPFGPKPFGTQPFEATPPGGDPFAGTPGGGGADRWRIWRDPDHGWIAGVCAGIADHLGVAPGLVRAAAVLGLVLFVVPTAVAYVALALVLKPRPPALFADPAQEAFWRGLRTDPRDTLDALRVRLRALDGRLARAETLVTSEEFALHRGFRDLGG